MKEFKFIHNFIACKFISFQVISIHFQSELIKERAGYFLTLIFISWKDIIVTFMVPRLLKNYFFDLDFVTQVLPQSFNVF